jgi:hypothetical protein
MVGSLRRQGAGNAGSYMVFLKEFGMSTKWTCKQGRLNIVKPC